MSLKQLTLFIWILLPLFLATCVPVGNAESALSQGNLTRDQEIDLAISGAPEHLRENCTVYLWDGKKYTRAREGSNGITCAVFRDGVDSSEPICYDGEGAISNMLVDMKRSELRKAGISEEEIAQKLEEGYKTGELRAPQRSGVAYMLSDRNFIFIPDSKAAHYPPHLMFYAPYLKNSDIGARKEDFGSTTVPWVLNEGTPEAYIIMVLGGSAHSH